MMRPYRSRLFGLPLLSAVFLATACTIAPAEDPAERSYPVLERGRVEMTVPGEWKEQVNWKPGEPPMTVVYTKDGSKEFEIFLSILWNPDGGFNFSENWARQTAHATVQSGVEVSSDAAPAYGNYFYTTQCVEGRTLPCQTQAHAGLGEVSLTLTILTPKPDAPIVADALGAFATARFAKGD